MTAVPPLFILSLLLLIALMSGTPVIERAGGTETAELEYAPAMGTAPCLAAAVSRCRSRAWPQSRLREPEFAAPYALRRLNRHAGRPPGDARPRLPTGLHAPLRN